VSEDYALVPGQGWKHSVRVGEGEVWTEDVVAWLITLGPHPTATPVTRRSEHGAVWHPHASDDIDLPPHVIDQLGLAEVEQNETWTRPSSRWAE
jgi:hypothetical protein